MNIGFLEKVRLLPKESQFLFVTSIGDRIRRSGDWRTQILLAQGMEREVDLFVCRYGEKNAETFPREYVFSELRSVRGMVLVAMYYLSKNSEHQNSGFQVSEIKAMIMKYRPNMESAIITPAADWGKEYIEIPKNEKYALSRSGECKAVNLIWDVIDSVYRQIAEHSNSRRVSR